MTITVPPPAMLLEDRGVTYDDVSWQAYEALLDEIGNRPIRVTYYEGRMEIMPPLPVHEIWKSRIGRMIEVMAMELNFPMKPLGSTTFRRQSRSAGLEPDECYYFKNAHAIRGKDRLDLETDPPPDLAVEIDITRRSISRQKVYQALGVPEVWRFDGKRLTVLLLSDEGYTTSPSSRALPFLSMEEFLRQLLLLAESEDTPGIRAFQKWVRTLPGWVG